MLHLKTPNGINVDVPENLDEDKTPRFEIGNNIESALCFYKHHGYVIFQNCITKNICDEISSWEIPDGIFETEPTYEERIGYHLSCVAIVRVENENAEPWSLGTGFYYDKNKLITNYHVIKSAKNIYVAQFTDYIEVKQGGSNTLKTARLIKSDPSNDIAILETLSENFSSCQFSDNSPDLLSEVIAIGHPNGLFYTLSKGDINAYRSKGKDFIQNKDSLEIYSIHMDAPIYPGSSGGPLFYKGKVVGVNYAGHTDTTLNFSIHFNVAKRFIK